MADITIAGKAKLNAFGYSVVEDSTPLDPSSSAGGFGQITVTMPDYPNSPLDMGGLLMLADGARGETEGTIVSLLTDETTLTITANSYLAQLSVTATAAPYSGSLGGYFSYLLGLVGITSGFQVDPAIAPARTNLSRNPKLGVNANDWSGSGSGAVTSARTAGSVGSGPAGVGDTWMRVTASAAGTYMDARTVGTGVNLVTPGNTYTFSAYMRPTSAATCTANLFILWLDGSGATLSSATISGPVLPAVVWTRASITATAPAGAVRATIIARAAGALSIGDRLDVTGLLFEVGSALGTYFDGDTIQTNFAYFSWSGTANASTSTAGPVQFAFPGWQANVWDRLKAFCAAQGVEVTFASDSIVMRPVRQNLAVVYRDQSHQLNLDQSNIAQQVSCFYYQGVQQASGLAYPLGGLSTNPTILQVDASQTIVSTIPLTPSSSNGTGLGVSLSAVAQPVAVDTITMSYAGTSAYQILDQNGNLYPALKWAANGGSVTVALGADGVSLVVTVTGCGDSSLGPYRLAITDPTNPTMYHSSLFITGTGVFYNKQLLTIPTGNGNVQTANVSPPIIDNFAISDISTARSAALWACVPAQGPTATLSVAAMGINAFGDQQSYALMTMGQFDSYFATGTFGAFDATWSSSTFGQFDAWANAQVSGEFANQAFGNVAGARVLYQNTWYRISAATIAPGGISYTAIADTTMGDFDAVWSSMTFGQFDAVWSARKFGQFAVAPLKNS